MDAAVIMVENAHKHYEEWGGKRSHLEIITRSAQEVGPTLFFTLLVITVSFLPVFTLQAQEGRLFKPLAFTKTYSMGAAALLSACMTAKLEESRALETRIASSEVVVLLAKPHVDGAAAEDDFMDCVGDRIARESGILVQGNNEFQDEMFPWFEASTAPLRAEGVAQLLRRPAVRQRIEQNGVR